MSTRQKAVKKSTTANTEKKVQKLVLLLGFNTRNMDLDGVIGLPGPVHTCTSDELRVASLESRLPQDTRVLTINKQHNQDNPYHFAANFNSTRWVGRFQRELQKTFADGVEVTDVYLDYFNIRASVYREFYGTKWCDILSDLQFTGTAYLPVCNIEPEEAYTGVLRAAPGTFITNVDAVPLCKAASLYVRDVHKHYVTKISGYMSFTPEQVNKWNGKKATKTATKTKPSASGGGGAPLASASGGEKKWRVLATLDGVEYAFSVRLTTGPKYSIVVPKAINFNKSRVYVNFSKCSPFGDDLIFGIFLKRKFTRLVRKWKKMDHARDWLIKRIKWKDAVSKMWRQKRNHNTRLTPAPPVPSAPVVIDLTGATEQRPQVVMYSKAQGHAISLPDFPEFRTSRTAGSGQRQAIRLINPTKKRKRDGNVVYLAFPGVLLGKPKGEKYSLGKTVGVPSQMCMKFLAEHILYAVTKWKSVKQARKFVQNRKEFVEAVLSLWDVTVYDRLPIQRHWEIRASTLPVDERYVKAGFWPESARWDKGCGLFCVNPGYHYIYFTGPTTLTIETSKTPTNAQGIPLPVWSFVLCLCFSPENTGLNPAPRWISSRLCPPPVRMLFCL